MFGYESIWIYQFSSFHILITLHIRSTTCSWIRAILDTSQFLICQVLITMFIASTTCSRIRVVLDTSQFLLCNVLMTSQAPSVAGCESAWIQVLDLPCSRKTTCLPYSKLHFSTITFYESNNRISSVFYLDVSFRLVFADNFCLYRTIVCSFIDGFIFPLK